MCSDGKSTMQDFDVIISSEVHGLTIGRRGIFPAWSFSSDHKLELHESAGWVLVDTNDPPRFAFMSKEWVSPFLCINASRKNSCATHMVCVWQSSGDDAAAVQNQQYQDPR